MSPPYHWYRTKASLRHTSHGPSLPSGPPCASRTRRSAPPSLSTQWGGASRGRRARLRIWARVLARREDEVQPLGGFQDDPLLEVVDAPAAEDEEPLAIRTRLLGRWGTLLFALHLLYARFWAEPDCEQRTIFLPREKAEELQRQATAELAAEAVITADSKDAPQPAPPPPPFISEGDVLAAWCANLACGD